MLKKNETMPEIEQLNRHEFDLDIEEQLKLQAEADQEVERVRNLLTCSLWERRQFKDRVERCGVHTGTTELSQV